MSKSTFPNTIKRNGKVYKRMLFASTKKEAKSLQSWYKTKDYRPYKSVIIKAGTASNGKKGYMLYGYGLMP